MKKVGIGLFFLCCCCALLVWLLSGPEEEIAAAEFLPENILFYGEQQDFSKMYQEVKGSRLGETLESLDYFGTAVELGVAEDKIRELETLWQNLRDTVEGVAFQQLFGKEFSVALFPANFFSAANPARALEERLLLIARPRHNVQLLQFLSQFFIKNLEPKTVRYGKYTLTRYKIDEVKTLATVEVKGLLLAGFDERLVRKSLDCYDAQDRTLQQNKEFQRLRQDLKQAKLFSYLSLPALYEQGRVLSENLPKEDQQLFLTYLSHWQGLGAAAYGAWQEEGLVKDKAVIQFKQDKLDAKLAQLYAVPPSLNKTLSMVPADVLFYYWTNTLNLPLMWDIYSSWLVDQSEDLGVLRQEVSDATGEELESILAMIGKEFAFLIKDIDSEGIPLPKAALMIQLTKVESFRTVFEKLLLAGEIPINKEKYGDQSIVYWGIAPQPGLQPAFCVQGKYLLLANSMDVIKEIIDLKNNPDKNLLVNPEIQQVANGLLLENNSAAYIDIARLAGVLKNLASWAGTIAMLQSPEAGYRSQVMVKQVVLPLLDGVTMYSKLGSRSIIEKDTIILESTTSVVQ